jgi:hypothetical protein
MFISSTFLALTFQLQLIQFVLKSTPFIFDPPSFWRVVLKLDYLEVNAFILSDLKFSQAVSKFAITFLFFVRRERLKEKKALCHEAGPSTSYNAPFPSAIFFLRAWLIELLAFFFRSEQICIC